MYRMVVLN